MWLNHPPFKKSLGASGQYPQYRQRKTFTKLSNELYIYVLKKKKQQCKLNTSDKRKLHPGLSPLLLLAGPCGQQVQANAAQGHWGHPRAGAGGWMDHPHVLRCLAQPKLGVRLAQESGPRLDMAPWPQVRNCPATGGATAGRNGTAAHPGPQTAASIKEGKRKTSSREARSCGVLFTQRRTPTSQASCGRSGLKSR